MANNRTANEGILKYDLNSQVKGLETLGTYLCFSVVYYICILKNSYVLPVEDW